jgi:hypothetical protein
MDHSDAGQIKRCRRHLIWLLGSSKYCRLRTNGSSVRHCYWQLHAQAYHGLSKSAFSRLVRVLQALLLTNNQPRHSEAKLLNLARKLPLRFLTLHGGVVQVAKLACLQ